MKKLCDEWVTGSSFLFGCGPSSRERAGTAADQISGTDSVLTGAEILGILN